MAVASLSISLQTAHYINQYVQNTTFELEEQVHIDQKILTWLEAMKAAILWSGEHQQALWTRSRLSCEAGFSSFCITFLPYHCTIN
jgi:hypothetical protein